MQNKILLVEPGEIEGFVRKFVSDLSLTAEQLGAIADIATKMALMLGTGPWPHVATILNLLHKGPELDDLYHKLEEKFVRVKER